MFEKYIISYLKKNRNYKKYELIFNHNLENSRNFRGVVFSPESTVVSVIEGLLYSTVNRDEDELESESILLQMELERVREKSKELN